MSALVLASNQTYLANLAEETGLTVEELEALQGEQEFLRDSLPIWRFNGNAGVYVNKTALKDRDFNPDEHPKMISVVVLAIAPAQALLRTDEEQKTYDEVMLCYNNDKVKQTPRLNAKLPPEQLAKLKERGAGVNCATCPLGRPKPVGTENRKPDCNSALRMLVLSDQGETFVLNISGISKPMLERFIADNFKAKKLLTIASTILLGREFKNDKEKSQSYYVAVPSMGEPIPKDKWRALVDHRAQFLASFESADESAIEEATGTTPAAAPPPPAPQAQFSVDENGNPIFEDPLVDPSDPLPDPNAIPDDVF